MYLLLMPEICSPVEGQKVDNLYPFPALWSFWVAVCIASVLSAKWADVQCLAMHANGCSCPVACVAVFPYVSYPGPWDVLPCLVFVPNHGVLPHAVLL